MSKELIKVCSAGKSGKDDAGEILSVDVNTLSSTGASTSIELCVTANCIASRDDFFVALSKSSSSFYIHAWDKEKPLCKFFGHERLNCIQQVSEEFTVAGAINGNLLIWQTVSGDLVQIIQNAHFQSVLKICALPGDDPFFVTAGMDGLIKIWNVRNVCGPDATCQPLAILTHKSVSDVFLAPSGRILVSEEDRVHMYDDIYAGAELIASFTFPVGIELCALNTLEDLLVASAKGEVYIINFVESDDKRCIKSGLSRITAIGFSEDDSKLILGSDDGNVQLWDLQSQLLVKQNDKLSKYSITGFYPFHATSSTTPKLNQFKRQLSEYKPLVIEAESTTQILSAPQASSSLDEREMQALREEVERLKKVNASLMAAILNENK